MSSRHAELVESTIYSSTRYIVQRTCADKILGLGECHPDVLKIWDECGGHVLNMGPFVSSFFKKTPAPNWLVILIHPKFGLVLGATNTSFVSSIQKVLFYFAQRHRGTPCLGSEWDQGVKE